MGRLWPSHPCEIGDGSAIMAQIPTLGGSHQAWERDSIHADLVVVSGMAFAQLDDLTSF
jgi:hypothetical protein